MPEATDAKSSRRSERPAAGQQQQRRVVAPAARKPPTSPRGDPTTGGSSATTRRTSGVGGGAPPHQQSSSSSSDARRKPSATGTTTTTPSASAARRRSGSTSKVIVTAPTAAARLRAALAAAATDQHEQPAPAGGSGPATPPAIPTSASFSREPSSGNSSAAVHGGGGSGGNDLMRALCDAPLEHPDLVRVAQREPTTTPEAVSVEACNGAPPHIFLATSPFAGRNSTIIFRPFDADVDDRRLRVVPVPMLTDVTADAVTETLSSPLWRSPASGSTPPPPPPARSNDGAADDLAADDRDTPVDEGSETATAASAAPPSGFPRVKRVGCKGPKYGSMLVAMPDRAVRFSAIMALFGGAGLTETQDLDGANWVLRWAKRVEMDEYGAMLPYQKINHFPGTWGVGRKDNLHRRMHDLARRRGYEHYPFVPKGFILPQDRARLEADYNDRLDRIKKAKGASDGGGGEARRRPMYIRKQVAGACGRGMRVITRPPKRATKSLIQEYIDDPLLINERKFDLRIYVVVTSFNPLRVYVHREGLCRFASSPYPTGPQAMAKCRTAHLTNYSVNVHNKAEFVKPSLQPSRAAAASTAEGDDGTGTDPDDFKPNEDDDVAAEASADDEEEATGPEADDEGDGGEEDDGDENPANDDDDDDDDAEDRAGSKWTFEMLRRHFAERGWDYGALWAKVDDVIIKTLLAVEPDVAELVSRQYGVNMTATNAAPGCDGAGNNFELFGFDILPRDDGTVSLMEVNIMPSLQTSGSHLDQHVKGNMLAEMLTLIGVHGVGQKPSPNKATGDALLDSLPPTIAPIVKASEEEYLRRGHFRRIFPTATAYDRYKPFFREARPLNALLQQWEVRKATGAATVSSKGVNSKMLGKIFAFDGTGVNPKTASTPRGTPTTAGGAEEDD